MDIIRNIDELKLHQELVSKEFTKQSNEIVRLAATYIELVDLLGRIMVEILEEKIKEERK